MEGMPIMRFGEEIVILLAGGHYKYWGRILGLPEMVLNYCQSKVAMREILWYFHPFHPLFIMSMSDYANKNRTGPHGERSSLSGHSFSRPQSYQCSRLSTFPPISTLQQYSAAHIWRRQLSPACRLCSPRCQAWEARCWVSSLGSARFMSHLVLWCLLGLCGICMSSRAMRSLWFLGYSKELDGELQRLWWWCPFGTCIL